MKKILSLILIIVMALGLASCGETIKPAPKEISYKIREDNIEIKTIHINPDDSDSNASYLEISGLKDKEIEASINKEIKEAFDKVSSWEEIPPYRGIKLDYEKWKDKKPNSENTYAYDYCKVGNILSIVIESYRSYNNEEYTDWFNMTDAVYLNFDLNTGKQIKITDVFDDSVNGLEYINNIINDSINNSASDDEQFDWQDDYNSFKLVGEFPGITEDQKFSIDFNGSTINLAFDYDTPWVQTYAYYPRGFAIDIKDVSALPSKYVGENIYEDETECYRLISWPFDDQNKVTDRSWMDNHNDVPGAFFECELTYYTEMPEKQIEYIKNFPSTIEHEVEVATEFAKEHPEYQCYFSLYASPYRVGKYTTVYTTYYFDAFDRVTYEYAEDQLDIDKSRYKYYVFKEGVEEPLELKDLFVEGYDLSRLGIENIEDWTFELSESALYFRNGMEWKEFAFRDIGCENMTIFD